MANNLKIAFLGTPLFAVKILEEMKKGGLTPALIITAPDKPKGRKLALTPPPVKDWADKEKIPALQPDNLNDIYADLKKENWDIFILAAYGKIIPQKIIEMSKFGILNVHPSLLPKYRGPSPIQSAILNGDKKFGATIMLLDEKLDHGPILSADHLTLADNVNYKELEDKLAELGGKLLVKTVPLWVNDKIKAIPQDHNKATYTEKIKKENGLINSGDDPQIIEKKFRAFNPWPGVYFFLKKNKKLLRIIITGATLTGGKLKIEKVKPEGKKETTFADFMKENPKLKPQIDKIFFNII